MEPQTGLDLTGSSLKPLRSLRIEGLAFQPEERVLAALGQEIGRPFNRAAFERGVDALWEVYRILVVDIDDPPEGDVVVRVVETPVDLEPRFIGNNRYSDERLREWGRISGRGEIYLHEAPAIRERLLENYRRKGYAHVEITIIDTAGDPAAGTASDVIFEVREGPKVRVKKIEVRGNDSLPDTGWGPWRGGLVSQSKLKTKGLGLLRWFGGIFVENELQADLVAMRNVYRDRGWLDARVELERLDYSKDRSAVRVFILVDEGPLWTVDSVRIEGFELDEEGELVQVPLAFPEAEMREELSLTPGEAFEAARLQADQRSLRSFYGSRGFIDASLFDDPAADGWRWLTPQLLQNFEKKTIQVTYRMRQGSERFLREIRFAGNTHTRDKILRRELSVEEGDRVDLDEVQRSLGRIDGTGYFRNEQSLDHRDPYFVFVQSEDDPGVVDLEYRVMEGRVLDAGLSGGISSERGLVGNLTLSKRNFDASNLPSSLGSTFDDVYDKEAFHGNGELLQLDLAPGSEVTTARLRYVHPDIFGTHYDRWSLDSEIFLRDRLFRSHDEDHQRVRLILRRLFGFHHSFGFGPVWQRVQLSDLQENIPDTLANSSDNTKFQGIYTIYRYSDLDNNFAPRDGYSLSWTNTLYGGPFGGDNDLWSSDLRWNGYFPLKNEAEDVFPGFFVEVGAELDQPFGSGPDVVHYSERGFLGGPSTLRGFDFRGVGPFGGDYPEGSQTLLRTTLEYRFPLYSVPRPGTSKRREVFRGFFFLDAGVADPDSFSVDWDETRAAWGFGFGLAYPLPLTFNFGFPLREKEGDDREVFSFRISLR